MYGVVTRDDGVGVFILRHNLDLEEAAAYAYKIRHGGAVVDYLHTFVFSHRGHHVRSEHECKPCLKDAQRVLAYVEE